MKENKNDGTVQVYENMNSDEKIIEEELVLKEEPKAQEEEIVGQQEESTEVKEEVSEVIENVPVVTETKEDIKIDKLSYKERKKLKEDGNYFEREFYNRNLYKRDKIWILLDLIFFIAIIASVFLVKLDFELPIYVSTYYYISFGVSVVMLLIASLVMYNDGTHLIESDPITDYYILNNSVVSKSVRKSHFSKINTRFLTVTFLKLFKKGFDIDTMTVENNTDASYPADEKYILDFIKENNIMTYDDFIRIIDDRKGKDKFYLGYKKTIFSMAKNGGFVNKHILVTRLILEFVSIVYAIIGIFLIMKDPTQYLIYLTYIGQSLVFFIFSNYAYSNSRGAHVRKSIIKKQKKRLLSDTSDITTMFIYHYIYNSEVKCIKKLEKLVTKEEVSKEEFERLKLIYTKLNKCIRTIIR